MAETKAKGKHQLHEILAVQRDLEGAKDRILNESRTLFGKRAQAFQGMVRSYSPLEEGGETFPAEDEQMITTVLERLLYTTKYCTRFMDCMTSLEATNAHASADVVVDGEVLLKAVPAQALLNLESRLKEFRGVLDAVPTLDQKKEWHTDATQNNVYVSNLEESHRSLKETKYVVVVPATEFHPAEIREKAEVVRKGTWTVKHFSGMITPLYKSRMIERCDNLLRAVKKARQRANQEEIVTRKVGDTLFKYILGD